MRAVHTIVPCLWFDGRALEAAEYWSSIFPDSEVLDVARFPSDEHGTTGAPMTVRFRLLGKEFTAINGGPEFPFTPAISLLVTCETQAEVDDYWAKLTDGGAEVQCGWLTDRFGVSWQVVPEAFLTMMASTDAVAVERTYKAMLGMIKLDIAELERAFEGS